MLCDETMDVVHDELQLVPGMKVLDVGCGSGEFTAKLGAGTSGISFVGVDLDPHFIEFAGKRACGDVDYPFEACNDENEYEFIVADGLDLPFEDDSFDAVVSHTYLTGVKDWKRALREMVRVCKPGCALSSITNMTDDFYGTGTYDLLRAPANEADESLVSRVASVKAQMLHRMDTTAGIPPQAVPSAFGDAGLEFVHCRPLAHYFSLSDALTTRDEAQRHIDLLHAIELEEIDSISSGTVDTMLEAHDIERYRELVDARYDELTSMRDDNREWRWIGNASLLVCGRKPE